MTDANLHPSVILIRDRLRDIFPDIKIPLETIGWHIRQSTSIDTICSNFATEILSFGKVLDPTQSQSSSSSTTIKDETLQSIYDVFNSIPREHINTVYNRLKDPNNPNWYDDIVNELLSYDALPSTATSKRKIDDEDLPDDYQRLLAILPDIDPDYAMECYLEFLENSSEQADFNTLVTSLIERGYTKLTDKLERLRGEQFKENIREPKFEMEEFLKTFPNPLEYFHDRTKNVSEAYKTHALIYLSNAFARVSKEYITEVLVRNNHRFAPSLKQLQEEFYTNQHKKSNNAKSKRLCQRARAPLPIPDIPDDIFYKELCFTKHEDEITVLHFDFCPNALHMTLREIDVVSVEKFDPNRALGLWHILATNLNMWKNKLSPTITYTVHDQLPDRRVQMNDLVEYYTRRPFSGYVPTSIKGIDTQVLLEKYSRYQWQGSGLLKLFRSDFGFIFVDDETPEDQPYQWVATLFGPTLFTSAGVDFMTRTRQPPTHVLNRFVRFCRDHPVVSSKSTNMFYTKVQAEDELYYLRDLQID